METFLTPSPSSTGPTAISSRYPDDESRWAAVQSRDPAADQAFVYCVRTTKIYCRPICKARLARRANIFFVSSALEAQNAGYRACRRCKPNLTCGMPEEDAVRKVREFVARAPSKEQLSSLQAMAKQSKLSKWHFHRVFKKVVGMTPSEYAKLCGVGVGAGETPIQAQKDQEPLQGPDSMLQLQIPTPDSLTQNMQLDPLAEFDWTSLGFLGEEPPGDFAFENATSESLEPDIDYTIDRTIIRFSVKSTSFGHILIAFNDRKVCLVTQGDSEQDLLTVLEDKFPPLMYEHCLLDVMRTPNPDPFRDYVAQVMSLLETPVMDYSSMPLPL